MEVESIANFLGKIEEAKSEFTNLEDNTFIDNTVMAKVFFSVMGHFNHLGEMFLVYTEHVEQTMSIMI